MNKENKYNQLRQLIYKRKYPNRCEPYFETDSDKHALSVILPMAIAYSSNIKNYNIRRQVSWAENIENQMLDLSLQDILWAINNKHPSGDVSVHQDGDLIGSDIQPICNLNLDHAPKDYPEQTLLKLIELIK